MNNFLQLPQERRLFAFRLVPPNHHVAKRRADYEEMLGPVFFGETPSFDEMMAAAAEFEQTFNATAK